MFPALAGGFSLSLEPWKGIGGSETLFIKVRTAVLAKRQQKPILYTVVWCG